MCAACLVDNHAHLDMPRFNADRDEVIGRAWMAGVTNIVSVGTDLASSRKATEIASQYPEVWAAVGIHPQEAKSITRGDIETLAELAHKPKVVTIGEIGLDFYRDYAPHEKQIEILKWQLGLATRLKLPVVVHCRQAEAELMPILSEWLNKNPTNNPGVIHCFSGTLATAQAYLKTGFYLGLGAYISYPSSKALREVVKQLPVDRLLLETDCPFLPPQSQRGQRNEPAYVVETAKELARIKEVGLEEVAEKTAENASGLFNIA